MAKICYNDVRNKLDFWGVSMREYKVVEVKMKGMLGFTRLTGEDLQELLNKEAKNGWIFDKHLAGETWLTDRDVAMLIFYREK